MSKSESAWAPGRVELEKIFRLKFGDTRTTGWGPRMRLRFGYFTPDDFYEVMLDKIVMEGCTWVDVGCGRDTLPTNPVLAKRLRDRCSLLLGVDPSDNIEENQLIHQRTKTPIELYRSERTFDLATFRMVVEHVKYPESVLDSLQRLIRPGGKVVVYTVNRWAPSSAFSLFIPFGWHHAIKRIFWKVEQKDTFPVFYRMNTRRQLAELFASRGFKESWFHYLDDCRIFGNFRILYFLNLAIWRLFQGRGLTYPENCLLGIYERTDRKI